MAEKGGHENRKSAAELRLEQLQKWREAKGRQHRPGREPLTSGIVKPSSTTKANLPHSRESSVKKTSAVKRKQKENAGQDDSYLEKFEHWRSEKKKKQDRESASKRPPWRPFSASKTNLFSQPLTRCCNHDHGTGARKKLAMDAGAAEVQDNAEVQGNQELLHVENNAAVEPHVDNIEDHQELLRVENNQDVQPHLNNTANIQGSQQVMPHNDIENIEELQPPVNKVEINEADDEQLTQLGNIKGNQNDPEVIRHLGNQEVLQPAEDNQSNPGAGNTEDNAEPLPRIEDIQDNLDVPEINRSVELEVSQEDDDDSDIMGAAAAVPKNMSMRQKLEQWLKAKGKTPSRFNSLLTFRTPAPGSARRSVRKPRMAAPFWPGLEDAGKEEEDAGKDAVTLQLETIFQECMSAIDEGYPSDNISGILDTVFRSIPQCVQHAQYWLCRARLAQGQGDDHRVVSMFEMAVAAHAEPYEDIKDALTAFVVMKEAEQPQPTPEDDGIDHVRPSALFKTPKRRSTFARLDQGAAFDSSMKMYSVTPHLFRRAHRAIKKTVPVPIAWVAPIVVTPVRRSARIRRASALHPPALQEHDLLVPSLADVSEEEFVLRANRALVREPPMADSDAD
ncbi:cytoskeleton-associated protein 2-like [Branchiostoma lanceolatum]|uniref:cytoskeleton-associated protein 2-like n=1 Tax=Branchiostoma lanceolatum TaxID=7740 RepID=UPI003455DB65